MAMSRAEMDRRIDEHFAFEANDDVEGVVATLAPDAEHDIVAWPGGPTRGRGAALPFYDALFEGGGMIRRENAWVDLGAIARQLPQD